MLTILINAYKQRDVAYLKATYLQDAINNFHRVIKKRSHHTIKESLFEVNKFAERLPKEQADNFHSVTAKLLYVATRARADILLPVGFLGT